jgi:hypothetical protein
MRRRPRSHNQTIACGKPHKQSLRSGGHHVEDVPNAHDGRYADDSDEPSRFDFVAGRLAGAHPVKAIRLALEAHWPVVARFAFKVRPAAASARAAREEEGRLREIVRIECRQVRYAKARDVAVRLIRCPEPHLREGQFASPLQETLNARMHPCDSHQGGVIQRAPLPLCGLCSATVSAAQRSVLLRPDTPRRQGTRSSSSHLVHRAATALQCGAPSASRPPAPLRSLRAAMPSSGATRLPRRER